MKENSGFGGKKRKKQRKRQLKENFALLFNRKMGEVVTAANKDHLRWVK
jgi:hypothetical protein